MFPGVGRQDARKDSDFAGMTKELVDIEMMAHGGSVIEVKRDGRQVGGRADGSKYARRITAETEMRDLRPGRRPRRA